MAPPRLAPRLVSTLVAVALGMTIATLFPPKAAAGPCSITSASPAMAPNPAQVTPNVPLPNVPIPNLPLPNLPLPNVPMPNLPVPTMPSVPIPKLPVPEFPLPHLPIGRKPKDPTTPPAAAATPPAAAVTPPAAATTPPAAAVVGRTSRVSWVNGPYSANNTFARFGISGADLGIMWDNGQTGPNNQILMAFGDTFGNCGRPDQEWRHNTLFRSSSRDLTAGMSVPDPQLGNIYAGSPVTAIRPNFSKEIISSLGLVPAEASIIPTAGISIGTTQYIDFMSVRAWGSPGRWSTNFSAIAFSNDNGENWTVARSTIRPSFFSAVPGYRFVWGYQNFQQNAYVRQGGYVYSLGTTSGRGGMAFLSRVPENSILDLSRYEYYTPLGWRRGKPFLAIQVIWDATSELSIAWNAYLRKFIVLYTDFFNNVVMRTADTPAGRWSWPTVLLPSTAVPGGTYAPYIHPWSSGRDLYFTLSLWSAYSVLLMHTTLK